MLANIAGVGFFGQLVGRQSEVFIFAHLISVKFSGVCTPVFLSNETEKASIKRSRQVLNTPKLIYDAGTLYRLHTDLP